MTITIDVSKLPQLKERRQALVNQAEVARIQDEKTAATADLEAKHRVECDRLFEEKKAREKEVLGPLREQLKAIEAPFDERISAICDDWSFLFDDDGELELCALSGLPILDGEEVFEEEFTGEKIIRALLPSAGQHDVVAATEDATDEVPA